MRLRLAWAVVLGAVVLGVQVAWATDAPEKQGEVDLVLKAEDFDLSADTARSVKRILGRMRNVYVNWLGLALPPQLRIEVTLVSAEQVYRTHEARVMGRTGHTNGFFVPSTGEAVVWRQGSDTTMRTTLVHEASHYLLTLAGLARAPKWLNEGLAEVFETAVVDGNAVWLDPRPAAQFVARVPGPAASVLMGGAGWDALPNSPWGPPVYAHGGTLCAFLMGTDAGRRTLGDLLVATASGDATAAVPVLERYPGGKAGLDRDFSAYLAQPVRIQLPVAVSAGSAAGWIRCKDGTLVRPESGAVCSSWVKGKDGLLRYETE